MSSTYILPAGMLELAVCEQVGNLSERRQAAPCTTNTWLAPLGSTLRSSAPAQLRPSALADLAPLLCWVWPSLALCPA